MNKTLSSPIPSRTALWVLLWWVFQQTALPALTALLPGLSDAWEHILQAMASFLVLGAVCLRFLESSAQNAVQNRRRLLYCVLFGFCGYYSSSYFVESLLLAFLPELVNLNDINIYLMLREAGWLMAFATVCLVPVSEELIFRGAIFGSVQEKNRVLAYALSAAVFSAVHIIGYMGSLPFPYAVGCFIQYLPAGLCLAWAYEKSDTIAAPILIHSIVNLLGLLQVR